MVFVVTSYLLITRLAAGSGNDKLMYFCSIFTSGRGDLLDTLQKCFVAIGAVNIDCQ